MLRIRGFDPKIDYVVGNDVHIPISISKGDFNTMAN